MIAGEIVLPLYLIISISIPTSSSVSISISIPTFNSTLFRRHCGQLATDAIIRGWHNVRLRPRAAATEAKGRRDCGAATAISRHPRPELAVNRYCDQFLDCFAFEDRWPSLAQLWSLWRGAPIESASSERAATAANGKT